METPRKARLARPEIQFTGEPEVFSAPTPADPAVTAAFIAFHRSTRGMAAGRRRGGFVSRGGLAFAALALSGFGGGLFLAVFSGDKPQASSSAVAARPPEMIYRAPLPVDTTSESIVPSYASAEDVDPAPADFARGSNDHSDAESSLWSVIAPPADPFAMSAGSGDAPSFAAIASQVPGSGAPGDLAGAGELASGFGALTVTTVPEPSTWATMLSGAGLLVLAGRFRRRR